MEKKMAYKNLDHALKLFRGQVIESIPYAIENFPAMNSPEKIFNYLKLRTTYKKDPSGVELFQTLPTLMDNNFHGLTGAGDCDCFTIAALATLIANGFTDTGIVLVGRNALTPVHIYAYVNDKGKRHYFDLTNKVYDYERFYPYKQHIPFKLNQSEKNMMLQLADGPSSRAPYYIHIPSQGVQVREDYFDNMSDGQFQNMCLSEGVDIDALEELSGRRAERRQATKAVKKANKAVAKAAKPRNVRKTQKLAIKQERVQGRNQVRNKNADARVIKQSRPSPAPAAFKPAPAAFPSAPQTSYSYAPQEPEYEEVYEEEVYEEEQPTEFETEMAQLFEGETDVLGIRIAKKILWIGGIALTGYVVGKQVKKKRTRRAA